MRCNKCWNRVRRKSRSMVNIYGHYHIRCFYEFCQVATSFTVDNSEMHRNTVRQVCNLVKSRADDAQLELQELANEHGEIIGPVVQSDWQHQLMGVGYTIFFNAEIIAINLDARPIWDGLRKEYYALH